MNRLVSTAALLGLIACDNPPVDTAICGARPCGDDCVQAGLYGGTPPVIAGPLELSGFARTEDDLSLLGVSVSGVPATSTSGQFATWTATLDAATLLALADASDQVTIVVGAVDVCGQRLHTGGCDPAARTACRVVPIDRAALSALP